MVARYEVPKSKTDKEGRGTQMDLLCSCIRTRPLKLSVPFCAVHCWSSPFQREQKNSVYRVYAARLYGLMIQAGVKFKAEEPGRVCRTLGAHSSRGMGLQELLRGAGARNHLIAKCLGRWASDAIYAYQRDVLLKSGGGSFKMVWPLAFLEDAVQEEKDREGE